MGPMPNRKSNSRFPVRYAGFGAEGCGTCCMGIQYSNDDFFQPFSTRGRANLGAFSR